VILDVVSTRMELMKLKKKEAVSRKGHKLLKDKLDELIRILMENIRQWKILREEINDSLLHIKIKLRECEYLTGNEVVKYALSSGVGNDAVISEREYKRVLNLRVPVYDFKIQDSGFPQYGMVLTSSCYEDAIVMIQETVVKLMKLSELERTMNLISEEVLKTRRRVNALEYYMIPNIQETISSISMKLEEQDRNTKSQLMRIKDIIRAPRVRSSANPGGGFKYRDQ